MYYFGNDYEGNRIKPYICLFILICWTIVDIILIVLVVMCFTGHLRKTDDKPMILPFKEGTMYCQKAKKKSMPQPKSQAEEDKMVADIKKAAPAKCKLFYLAYVAKGNRYISRQNANSGWQSVKVSPEVGDNPGGRYYFDVPIANGKVNKDGIGNFKRPDSSEAIRNFLLITRKKNDRYCTMHPFQCLYLYQPTKATTTNVGFEDAKREISEKTGREVICVVPYDPDQHPEEFNVENAPSSTVTAHVVATNYFFDYEYAGKKMGYTSKRFHVVDPEFDCLAYDVKRDKLSTFNCDEAACVVCL